MNKVFKVIFNQALGVFSAASELAQTKGRALSKGLSKKRLAIIFCATIATGIPPAYSASITESVDTNKNTVTIINSNSSDNHTSSITINNATSSFLTVNTESSVSIVSGAKKDYGTTFTIGIDSAKFAEAVQDAMGSSSGNTSAGNTSGSAPTSSISIVENSYLTVLPSTNGNNTDYKLTFNETALTTTINNAISSAAPAPQDAYTITSTTLENAPANTVNAYQLKKNGAVEGSPIIDTDTRYQTTQSTSTETNAYGGHTTTMTLQSIDKNGNVISGGETSTAIATDSTATITQTDNSSPAVISVKGTTYSGDSGTSIEVKPGKAVAIVGTETTASNGTGSVKNISVAASGENGNATLSVSLNKDIDLGSDGSVTAGNTSMDNTGLAVGQTTGEIFTGTQVTNQGITITDAQGKSSSITSQSITSDTVKANEKVMIGNNLTMTSSTDTTSGKTSLNLSATGNTPVKLTGVANGDIANNSQDAINGSQLFNSKINGSTATTANTTTEGILALTTNSGQTSDNVTVLTASITAGQGGTDNTVNTYMLKNGDGNSNLVEIKDTNTTYSIEASDRNDSDEKNVVKKYALKSSDQSSTGDVMIDTDTITKIAESDTTEVGKSEINNETTYYINVKATQFAGDDAESDGTNVASIYPGQKLNLTGGAIATNLSEANIGVVSDGNGGLQIKLSNNIKLADSGNITIGNTSINNDGMRIKNGPQITQDYVSMGGQQIHNVAPGMISYGSTDAVNGGQLYETNQRIDWVNRKVDELRDDMYDMGASLAALAGIHYQNMSQRESQIAGAVGTYKGRQALAFGVAHQVTNRLQIHASGTLGQESMANIGASFKF